MRSPSPTVSGQSPALINKEINVCIPFQLTFPGYRSTTGREAQAPAEVKVIESEVQWWQGQGVVAMASGATVNPPLGWRVEAAVYRVVVVLRPRDVTVNIGGISDLIARGWEVKTTHRKSVVYIFGVCQSHKNRGGGTKLGARTLIFYFCERGGLEIADMCPRNWITLCLAVGETTDTVSVCSLQDNVAFPRLFSTWLLHLIFNRGEIEVILRLRYSLISVLLDRSQI